MPDSSLQTLQAEPILTFLSSFINFDNTVSGTSGNDTLYGGAGDDTLNGGNGADTLNGGTGDDFIFGGDGNDILNGQAGADTLDGGAGNDWLNGGWGWDEMTGGSGADKFYHHGSQTGFGTEWISDFSDAEGDRLVLGAGASGSASDFVVTFATTTGRGSDAVAEAFVRYVPTGQVAWVLTDGADLDHIMIQTNEGVFDLLG
jgi:Ca2+-binding RTX toxin-like protein